MGHPRDVRISSDGNIVKSSENPDRQLSDTSDQFCETHETCDMEDITDET